MDIWEEFASKQTSCSNTENFFKAVSILIEKPHVVNRNLCGAQLMVQDKPFKCAGSLKDIFQRLVHIRSQIDLLCSTLDSCFCERLLDRLQENYPSASDTDDAAAHWKLTVRQVLPKNPQKIRKILELILTSEKSGAVLFFPLMTTTDDVSQVSDDQAFCLSYKSAEKGDKRMINIQVEESKQHPHHSEKWLSCVLLPKLVKWSEEDHLQTGISSLRLVPLERYNQVYQEMKEKYGRKLVEIWPERTDPLKFVYEEVAIASYLLVLFEEERRLKNITKRQSFVDLGCGNGLLVYVLASEGHPGKGIDVRKRAIWDMYGPEVILEECSITPSENTLYKEYDWLLGNHSDELTPWIPVFAARSSYECSYFVLPCCTHDFNKKFSDRRPGCSQYQSYLGYVKEVGTKCGFKVQKDMLRIPSTKRTCFIGCERTYAVEDEEKVDKERTAFIKKRCARGDSKRGPSSFDHKANIEEGEHGSSLCGTESLLCDNSEENTNCNCDPDPNCSYNSDVSSETIIVLKTSSESKLKKCHKSKSDVTKRKHSSSSEDDSNVQHDKHKCIHGAGKSVKNELIGLNQSDKSSWVQDFKPREQVEKVRNCTLVSKDLQEAIMNKVFHAVLEADDATNVITADKRNWNRGGSIPLSDVAKMFDKSQLGQLKKECGGLQTLLRNKHQIFMVVGGKVYLRYEDSQTPVRKEKKGQKDSSAYKKTKLCWFYGNHPDGCPKELKDCLFAHGADDIQSNEHSLSCTVASL